jgi:hypothetical protein
LAELLSLFMSVSCLSGSTFHGRSPLKVSSRVKSGELYDSDSAAISGTGQFQMLGQSDILFSGFHRGDARERLNALSFNYLTELLPAIELPIGAFC